MRPAALMWVLLMMLALKLVMLAMMLMKPGGLDANVDDAI